MENYWYGKGHLGSDAFPHCWEIGDTRENYNTQIAFGCKFFRCKEEFFVQLSFSFECDFELFDYT